MRGHITKRGSTWTAVVDLPPDPITGKRRQKRLSSPTKRGIEALVAATIQAAQTGFTDAGRLTVRDFLAQWLEAAAPTLRPSTNRRYLDLVRLHLVPVLGNVRLSKLGASDVQRLYADRLAAGLSPTSVRHVHGVLHRALDQAVRWGIVGRNVTEAVDPPRRITPEAKTWNAQQVATVLAAAGDDDLEALWRLALLTGMRRGELIGLRWRDLDLDRGILAVRRTLSRGHGSALIAGEPKTASGRRQIALPASAVDVLRRHRVRQLEVRLAAGPVYDDRDLVFAGDTGAPLHPNSLNLRFRRLITRADVPPIRFHDLRHTCATLMLANGEHPKVVQERLGHADIAMTMNLYSHVTADMQRDAADRLDALIGAAS
jgi:integrase